MTQHIFEQAEVKTIDRCQVEQLLRLRGSQGMLLQNRCELTKSSSERRQEQGGWINEGNGEALGFGLGL